jgi:NAD(P)-dependent dehydrogenase (short-subunit alcohol dehydrogenase family)
MTQFPLILVTGGSRGLGRAAALALAAGGADVILTYHSNAAQAATAVTAVEAEGRMARAFKLDIGQPETFATFADALRDALAGMGRDRIDGLINNAGSGVFVPYADTDADSLDRMYGEHLKGPYLLTQTLLPLIADGGRVLNVSSGLTRFSMPGYSAYAAMKGAVEVMTRYQAKELGERGISVNAFAPGAIETDFGGGAVRDNADLNAHIAGATALGRVGLPSDIGPAMAALVLSPSNWITGQRIEASGGMNL